MTQIKAISLTEPYASLIAVGEKRIETRGWQTDYRGPIAIHASRGFNGTDHYHAKRQPLIGALDRGGLISRLHLRFANRSFVGTRGRIVAIANLSTCVPLDDVTPWHRIIVDDGTAIDVTENEFALGGYGNGRYGFLLTSVVSLLDNPIPAIGSLGLWSVDVPGEIVGRLSASWELREVVSRMAGREISLGWGVYLGDELYDGAIETKQQAEAVLLRRSGQPMTTTQVNLAEAWDTNG